MSKALPAFFLVLILIIIALPAALARGCRPPAIQRPPTVDRTPIESPAGEITIRVYHRQKEEIVEMPLEEYVAGVVASEMPASFGLEALKAQAVVARTYTVTQMRSFGGKGCDRHPEADICTDSTHCQAWEPEEDSLARWPSGEAANFMNKIRRAVRETAGQAALHNGRTVDAVFHSHCGGHTENSEDVWTSALPYLRAVACPYCAGTRWSETKHVFTGAQFAQRILPYVSAVPVSAAGRPLLGTASRTATERVRQITVAGEAVSGRDFRSALNLPSTKFSWRIEGDTIIFTNRGYGHGVGLCQYGADGMAQAGKTYSEIISYYYTGVEVAPFPAP